MINLTQIVFESFSVYLTVDRKQSNKSVAALKSRFDILTRFFQGKPFNRENFNLFIQQRIEHGDKKSYLNTFIKTAKHLSRYLTLVDPTHINDLSDYSFFNEDDRREVELLTTEEVQAMAVVKLHYRPGAMLDNDLMYLLINFLALVGSRIGETLSLKEDCVYENPYHVKFTADTTKTKKTYYSPITPALYALIQQYKREGLIFGQVTRNAVLLDLKRRARACHVKEAKVFNHAFRHYFINALLKGKAPLQEVARLAHHADIATTNEYYTHINLEELTQSLLVHHPMVKHEQSFDLFKSLVKETIEGLTDSDRYKYEWIEDGESIRFECRITDASGKEHP